MPRIAGVDVPDHKRGEIALTEIYGIGRSRAQDVLQEAEIDRGERDGIASDERERLKAENAELKRRNKRLEQEREILKTAAVFFAQETDDTR